MCIRDRENLEAYPVAVVTESPRMVMHWQGHTIVDLSRAFLDTNGAAKHTTVRVDAPAAPAQPETVPASLREMASSLKCASRPVSYTHLDVYKRQEQDLPLRPLHRSGDPGV